MDKVKETVSRITGASKLPTAKLGKNGPQDNRSGYGTMGLVSWGEPCSLFFQGCMHVLILFSYR